MANKDLAKLDVFLKSGEEKFHSDGIPLNFNLLSFWQWSSSDIVNNSMRGVLAEYIVAKALKLKINYRVEWDGVDLETTDGLKIEVKSAAYIQSWAQEKYSNIVFGISKKHTLEKNNQYSAEKKWQADVYIFALLSHKDKNTIDPLNVEQWEFYLVPTSEFDNKKTISLKKIQKLNKPYSEVIKFNDLQKALRLFLRDQNL